MSLPKITKAAILVAQNQPLEIAEIALPRTLEAGQVLVEVFYSGICGSQLGEIDGAKGPDKFLPHLLGHEGSGKVLAVGPGVRKVAAGDIVVLHWRKGPGIEAATPVYDWNGEKVNAGWVTTFNQYAVISENRLTAIPADSNIRIAPLFGCAVTTGFGVVTNDAKLQIGESVVVAGAGGIGLNIVQAAAMASAWPVIAVDLVAEKLALAKSLGATHTIDASREDVKARIREILGAQALDAFIDNTGQPSVIEMGYELAAPEGRVILVGVPRKGNTIDIYSLPLHFGKILKGSHGGDAKPERDILRYLRLYNEGRIPLKDIVTDEFSLDDINEAIARMRSGKIRGRCLIKM
ncbi:MAG: zinc-binding dehydrogenase [Pseudomonadota bacterium]|nr:zinc-binding dehydrogenase [Pseudomonadota bacterium]